MTTDQIINPETISCIEYDEVEGTLNIEHTDGTNTVFDVPTTSEELADLLGLSVDHQTLYDDGDEWYGMLFVEGEAIEEFDFGRWLLANWNEDYAVTLAAWNLFFDN